MRVVREVHRKEAEIRHKLENEEFFDEEEDEEDWGSDVDSEGGDSNGDENCDVAANPKESKGKLENDGRIKVTYLQIVNKAFYEVISSASQVLIFRLGY